VNKKEEKEQRQFEKNWHHVKKAGGPIYYNELEIERGKMPFLMLSIIIQKQPDTVTLMEAIIELTKSNVSTKEVRVRNANIKDIISGLEDLQLIYLKSTQLVPRAKKQILQKAINQFHQLRSSDESTLTLRLNSEQAEQIKEAGRRAGLRVSTKILLFTVKYFLLQTAADDMGPAPEDPTNEDPPKGED